jgi:hypothetical protein
MIAALAIAASPNKSQNLIPTYNENIMSLKYFLQIVRRVKYRTFPWVFSHFGIPAPDFFCSEADVFRNRHAVESLRSNLRNRLLAKVKRERPR